MTASASGDTTAESEGVVAGVVAVVVGAAVVGAAVVPAAAVVMQVLIASTAPITSHNYGHTPLINK